MLFMRFESHTQGKKLFKYCSDAIFHFIELVFN